LNYLILDDYLQLLATVTAFANTQGGTIILGIRDSDRLIVGLNRELIECYSQEIPMVEATAVGECQKPQFMGNSKDHMKVRTRQEFGQAVLDPPGPGRTLAQGAMTVPA